MSVNETLLYGNGTIQYLPGLASNWTVSPDGTTYTLNLRQDVKFSDGNPFNAYQVWLEEYGFYYLSGNSSYWWENYNIFNMSSVNFGLSTVAALNASSLVNPSPQALAIMSNSAWPIYVPNANQIVFRLAHPFIWFPGTLVAFQGLIYDAQWMLDHGGFGTLTNVNSYFNQNPIPGSGPYKVTQVAENNFVSFMQDPNYWGLSLTPAQIAAQPDRTRAREERDRICEERRPLTVHRPDHGSRADIRHRVERLVARHLQSPVWLRNAASVGWPGDDARAKRSRLPDEHDAREAGDRARDQLYRPISDCVPGIDVALRRP